MRWLWAAYKQGAMSDFLQANLKVEAFQEQIIEIIGSVDLDWMAEVQTGQGLRPAALILADYRFGGNAIEPHVLFFPWATARNKLEISLAFLTDIGRTTKVFIYARADEHLLWERIWQYNALKKGCKIPDCYGKNEDAVMYYTPGPF